MLKLSQQKIEHHNWVGSSLALCSGGHIRILAQRLAVVYGFHGPQSFQQNAALLPLTRPWLLLSINHVTPTSALLYNLCVHFFYRACTCSGNIFLSSSGRLYQNFFKTQSIKIGHNKHIYKSTWLFVFIIFQASIGGNSQIVFWVVTLFDCALPHVLEQCAASIFMAAESCPGWPWHDMGEEVGQFYSCVGRS